MDIGCGTGLSSSLLDRAGYRVVGVDISDLFLNQAYASDRVKLISADAHMLPFPDASFDTVTSYEFIEHVYRVEQVLDEMIRITRPGGIILILSPNLLSPFPPLKSLLMKLRGQSWGAAIAGTHYSEILKTFVSNTTKSIRKCFSRRCDFLYRKPDLSQPGEADSDSTYVCTQLDLKHYFKSQGLKLAGGSEGHSLPGKVIAALLPNLCGECCVVAKKPIT